ncbi:MAG: hypothetical protein JSU86_17925 [Phycisphaerales bacterium]|nr:MAG: hypothetical protein JSU86_17925 [Phycisphaerales bacterium]
MKTQRSIVIAAGVAAGVVFTSVLMAGGDRDKVPPPRDVTLTGKIVDLHSFMTDKFESSDHVRCTQRCIQAGVPAALATEDELIIIGEGQKGPARTIAPLAFRYAELKGKLYERKGIKYIDVASVKAAKDPESEEDMEEDWETDRGWDDDEERDHDDPERGDQ